MKLHIWTNEVSYLAVCHADSVAEARELLKSEVGGTDGSCQERAKAWEEIKNNTSAPYNGRVAAFCLSDSAEVREQIAYSEKVCAERDSLRAELAAAKEQIESDRTKCAEFVTALDKALDSRFWLTEGRGSYSWDDDRYRSEFKGAAEELLAVTRPMRAMAANMASSPRTTAEVIQARADLNAELAAAHNAYPEMRAEIERLRNEVLALTTKGSQQFEAFDEFLAGIEAVMVWVVKKQGGKIKGDELEPLASKCREAINLHGPEWLAARDARMKAEGAADWIDRRIATMAAAGLTHDSFGRGWFKTEAARLRLEAGE